jgi:hypothetical protein
LNTAIPNFFIVGAAKAGTTSLYHYLAQHPAVYMSPIKEPNYFSTDIDLNAIRPQVKERINLLNIDAFIKGPMKTNIHRAFITKEDQYLSLFRHVKNEKAIGDASASYLFSKVAAQNIYNFNSKAKIIIVLRQPVQRMYSHYLMDRRMAVTTLEFERALLEDRANPSQSWGSKSLYYELSEYFEQVKRYYDVFSREQILILLSDELRDDAQSTMQKIFLFLEISPDFRPNLKQEFNSGVLPRNSIVSKIITNNYLRIRIRQAITNKSIKNIVKKILFKKPTEEKIAEETNNNLLEYFSNDIHKLSKLIQMDLSKWLKKK